MQRTKYAVLQPTPELIGKEVKLHLNKHTDSWSVKCAKTSKLLAHVDHAVLVDCQFHVGAGRAKVLESKRKGVHAWVRGTLLSYNKPARVAVPVTYNPYRYESFVDRETESPVWASRKACFHYRHMSAIDPR
jgi:hypothetical protein